MYWYEGSSGFHRQMYIDLIGAYLRDYGSAKSLARALNITPAAISQLLKSARLPWETGQSAYWIDSLLIPGVGADVRHAFRSPTSSRGDRIAAELCSDKERRDVLLHHMEHARVELNEPGPQFAARDPEEVKALLAHLGSIHAGAMHTGDPLEAGPGYQRVWDIALEAIAVIHPAAHTLERAQTLMYLHDAACVFDRADLALGYAREAILLLHQYPSQRGPEVGRLAVNAAFAEVVALNNLGLYRDVQHAAKRGQFLARVLDGSGHWHRSFLEQELKALSGEARFPISSAEYTAEHARELVPPGAADIVGIDAYMVQAYIAHGTSKSLRAASRLIESLQTGAASGQVSVLRRVRCLRAMIDLADRQRDYVLRDDCGRAALRLCVDGRLVHQRAELAKRYAWLDRVT